MSKENFENVDENIEDLLEVLDLSEDLKVWILAGFTRRSLVDYRRFEAAIDELHSSLNNLQVYVKYQTFDLEATRRENGFLRKLLEGEMGEIE